MPKIPEFQQRGQILSSAPPGVDINPNAYGRISEATGQVGAKLADIGLDLVEKRKKADDLDYFNKATNDTARQYEEYKQKLDLNQPAGGDYKGYTDNLNQWISKKYEDDQKAAPSETARVAYSQHMRGFFDKQIVEASGEEQKNRAVAFNTNIADQVKLNRDYLVQNPSASFAYAKIDGHKAVIQQAVGLHINGPQSDLATKHVKETMSDSALDGYYDKAVADPRNALAFAKQGIAIIKGQDKDSLQRPENERISNYLNPDKKDEHLKKFEHLIKARNEESSTELSHRVNDAQVQAFNGKPIDPTLHDDLDNAVISGQKKPEEVLRTKVDLARAATTYKISSQLATTSPSQWAAVTASANDSFDKIMAPEYAKYPGVKAASQPGFEAVNKQQTEALVQAAGQNILKQIQAQPADYVRSTPGFKYVDNAFREAGNDPEKTSKAIRMSVAAQTRMGVAPSDVRLTTSAETAQMADVLSSKDPGQVTEAFSVLQKKYGQNFSKVFSEAALADNRVSKSMWLGAGVEDPTSRRGVFAALINKEENDKFITDKEHREPTLRKDISDRIDTANKPFYEAISRISGEGGATGLANEWRSVITAKTNQLIAGGQSVDAAVKEASNLMKKDYGTFEGANSKLMFKRNEVLNEKVLEAYAESHMKPEALAEMNLHAPRDWSKDELHSAIKDTGTWVSTPDFAGMKLMFTDKSGARVPVREADGTPQGRVMVKKYKDVTTQMDSHTLNRLNKFGVKKAVDAVMGGVADAARMLPEGGF